MELTAAERKVLERFHEKTALAGGPKPGYLMRKPSICYFQDLQPELDLEAGILGVVDKGLLKPNEAGDRFALTAAGAEALESLFG